MILRKLSEGITIDELLGAYSTLERENIMDALCYSADVMKASTPGLLKGSPRRGAQKNIKIGVDKVALLYYIMFRKLKPEASMEEKIESILPGVSSKMQEAVMHALRLARTPIRSAVLVRAFNDITNTVELLDIESLENIAGASSNLDLLLSLFEESIVLESNIPFNKNPLRSVRLEGIHAKNKPLKK